MSAFSRLLCALVLLSFPWQTLLAQEKSQFLAIDLGAYADNLQLRYNVPDAYRSEVSTISGFLRVRKAFPFLEHFFFEPSAALCLPWQSSADGFAKTLLFQFGFDSAVRLFSFLRFRAGPGFRWLFTSAFSEDIALNNGTTSSTFFMPGRLTNVFLFTIEAGLAFRLSERLSLNVDSYLADVASNNRRSVAAALSLGVSL